MSQRVYIRGYSRYVWRQQYAEWESKDPKKRGAPPPKPRFEDISDEKQQNPEQLKDIEDIEGLDIENV